MAQAFWNGNEAAHRRVMMKAAGYSDEDIRKKPHIGVANSYMSGSPGSAHLRQLTEAVKEGIWAAGGVPVEFGVPATCGNIANGAEELKYEQVGRDIVAMSVEFVTRVHNFDGLIMVASCDNILAGCYLAACRLDLPALVVTGGTMQPGRFRGKTVVEADLDSARFAGLDPSELELMEDSVCPSCGACPSMGTANTMQLLGEVLNLVLPGTSSIPATDSGKLRSARAAGRRIIDLVREDKRPSRLITREVLLNAVMFDIAIAGSTNAVLHLLSYGYELGLELTLADFSRYAQEIPCIVGVIPSGPYTVVDLHYAGGAPQILKMLESRLFTDVPTLGEETLGQALSHLRPRSGEVIHSMDAPLYDEPGLQILYGSLSPKGAIVRPTAVYPEVKRLQGPARVFEGDRSAFEAIQRGDIRPGDVLVIRYEGCQGAPGMKELMLSIDALIGLGLHHSVGLVTDARFSGFNYGAIVGHVSPEAYAGGPIALVREGDQILIDIPGGRLDLLVEEEELERRRRDWVRPPLKEAKGCLNIYARLCRPAEEGGAMQPWERDAR